MKELVGKLSALDPEAGDALKVVTYFDTLMDGRVSLETLVRGAATLSGTAAGYRRGATSIRVLADGRRAPAIGEIDFATTAAGDGAVVWLERAGAAHANDEMIRERLAVAIAQSAARGSEQSPERHAVELLLTAPHDDAQRVAAEARLQLEPRSRVRAVALPNRRSPLRDFPSAVMATPWGIVRGGIVPARFAPASTSGSGSASGAIGIGFEGRLSELPSSWRSALVALALAGDGPSRADDFGSLIALATPITDSEELPADLAALESASDHGWTVPVLQAIADGESVRGIAAVAGLHHSSVHARLPELTRLLTFDPLTPLGRTRLYATLLLRRIATARFD